MKKLLILFLFSNLLFSEVSKKIIYYGWGTRDTMYVRENWEKMEEMPFDGIGITIAINRNKPTTGDGATGNILGWQIFSPTKFKYDDFKQAIDDLKVPKWKKFKDNFLPCAIATRDQDKGLNWFDEKRWKIIYNNWEVFIRIAKEGNLKGIFIDCEHYDYECELFCYKNHKVQREDRSFSEYKEIARKRGRDLIEIAKSIFPDITIFIYTGWSHYLTEKICSRKSEEDMRYSLLPSFLDGFLEGSSDKMKFVEISSRSPKFGWESIYGYIDRIKFLESYYTVLNQCISITRFPDIYRKRISCGFGLSLDFPHNREWNLNDLSKNYFTPEKFKEALKNALEISDEYVWIYTERIKFFPPENLPEEYLKAIKKAKGEE